MHGWQPIGAAVALLAFGATARAQVDLDAERFTFLPTDVYDETIPSPAEFLDYELGARVTPYDRVVAYVRLLAERSPRVTLRPYGHTYEHRPLQVLAITSEENQERLEEIRLANLRLADAGRLSDVEANSLIEHQPVIAWLSYNVHGNEPSSTEAALQVAYRLAAGQDEETLRILTHSVVIVDPCLNPDGRERYASWYNSAWSARTNTDQRDYEHDEPWPGGRTNHYWFDLNRDWVSLVHPESKGRVAEYQRWLPQVHVDYHEQGFNQNYFTMPGTTPRNLLLPDDYEAWSDRFGRANAAAFDAHRISYFTRESFDFFYPGYGSSYPSLFGGIGMLTEQGGGSRGARAVETGDGTVLTLRQRVFDHYLTSFAALGTAVETRVELLRYFRNTFTPASNKSRVSAYFIADNPDDLTYPTIHNLLDHGVRIERLQTPFTAARAYGYREGKPGRRVFPEGTFVIRTNQPRHLFINTVMQRRLEIEDSVMYDVAAWAMPLAANLDAAWTEEAISVDAVPVEEGPVAPQGVSGSPGDAYALVVDWQQRNAPRALAMLWEEGYRVRFVERPFRVGDRWYGRGTLVVLAGQNLERSERVSADMTRIASDAGVHIEAVASGRVDEGIDLVSPRSHTIKKPRVGLLVDAPFSSYTAGQIWHLFDRYTGLGISRYRATGAWREALGTLDVLILPGTSGRAPMDSASTERVKQWVGDGGTLVATEESALWLTNERSGMTPVELARFEDVPGEDTNEDVDGVEIEDVPRVPPSAYTPYAAREDSAGLRTIPGSALLGVIDETHPLAFGVGARLNVLTSGSEALLPSENLHSVGTYEPDPEKLLVAGYASAANLRKLAGNAFAAVLPMGRGRVVLLVANTQYRMSWMGPARLMQNAVMLVPGM